MPAPGGKRIPLVSYTWGGWRNQPAGTASPDLLRSASTDRPKSVAQGDLTRFRNVFQPDQGIFAPGYPLVPPDREAVRLWDFPVGYNTIYTPRSFEPIGFEDLRALADSHDITRLAIETRKDQIEKLDWTIKSRNEKSPTPDAATRIERLTEFWRRPDGEQPFATWLRQALEDVLVLDASTFEIRRNRGGDIIGLDVVDGSTIKLLFDVTGRRPQPPAPAFEQIIHGRPWRLLTREELLYVPRNPRPHKAYGFSPVEQIVTTVNIGLRRQAMQLQHFTEGNVPPGLLNAPDDWSPEQIRQFQEWFDSILAGNTGARTRLVWGPSGAKYQAFKEAPYKDDFDEWLARIVCYAFSLPPTAFTAQVNRATAQTAQETALEEGLAPLLRWVKRLVDEVVQNRMGHPDLEFAWSDVRPTDPTDQANILGNYVKDGIYTLNEARDVLGLDPVEGGDQPMFSTAQGPVLLRDAVSSKTQPGGDAADPARGAGH
jgi:HK97 family phage portal protein